ncbi:MAG: DUF7594 domain-containing protein [Puniceicoccales bacterium]
MKEKVRKLMSAGSVLGVVLTPFTILSLEASAETTLTISAEANAYVRGGTFDGNDYEDTNYGENLTLLQDMGSTYTYNQSMLFFRFDISSIDVASVTSASFQLTWASGVGGDKNHRLSGYAPSGSDTVFDAGLGGDSGINVNSPGASDDWIHALNLPTGVSYHTSGEAFRLSSDWEGLDVVTIDSADMSEGDVVSWSDGGGWTDGLLGLIQESEGDYIILALQTKTTSGGTRSWFASENSLVLDETYSGPSIVITTAIPEPNQYGFLIGWAALGMVLVKRKARRE